ncbi:PD-(D/E)XK nuclease-like domain-containing protein [Williamsia herbipolensis]|uniref:PD-(D/E)XK nuclease-like domain-containing protein n=1 Tax=Williamsia herbipolensis TaxID=1603258 RepID=A0AAU4K039_9NOCA|nr:PD-(D/E)XK nuclease-like domain-containing protein [Williamsia herbipolensis]
MTFAPGVYLDVDEPDYFADPALSNSGAKSLLTSPAVYRDQVDNPKPPTKSMELGTVVHTLVLGTGSRIGVVDADAWTTKAAKEEAAEMRARGTVPVLAHQFETAQKIAARVREHDIAGQLFADGDPEVSMWWRDSETDIMRRCRIDWMMRRRGGNRQVLVDLKTTATHCEAGELAKAVARYLYHMQSWWYCDGAQTLGLGADPAFVFVFVSTTSPHLVRVVELDAEAVAVGKQLARQAIDRFIECTNAGVWPGWPPTITSLSLPRWAMR